MCFGDADAQTVSPATPTDLPAALRYTRTLCGLNRSSVTKHVTLIFRSLNSDRLPTVYKQTMRNHICSSSWYLLLSTGACMYESSFPSWHSNNNFIVYITNPLSVGQTQSLNEPGRLNSGYITAPTPSLTYIQKQLTDLFP